MIKQAIVVKLYSESKTEYLAAYCKVDLVLFDFENNKAQSTFEQRFGELRQSIYSYCQSKLINYMVPTCYIFLSEFPLNNNGKIDRKQFKQPETKDFISSANSDIESHGFIASVFTKFEILLAKLYS